MIACAEIDAIGRIARSFFANPQVARGILASVDRTAILA
ncbi:hypothetical protein NCGM2_2902 [Pseudomonas aeruginosa NCGM2.S1]|nr:hypothetical protein NCGM2_2902 [Pseudomonas aeruginosa NCGM2.S1]